MADDKKHIVSVRMTASDHGKIKSIANRLNIRESDLIRYAIKETLLKLTPLHDDKIKGRELMPVFMDCGAELANYFDLDAERLYDIINCDVAEEEDQVEKEDVDLIAMAASGGNYIRIKLTGLSNREVDPNAIENSVRDYLLDKYINPPGQAKVAKAVNAPLAFEVLR